MQEKKLVAIEDFNFYGGQVKTVEQATVFMNALISDMRKFRALCDIQIPDRTEKKVLEQKRVMWMFLQKQGKVMGALETLYLCGIVDEVFLNKFKEKATQALLPTVVGSFNG